MGKQQVKEKLASFLKLCLFLMVFAPPQWFSATPRGPDYLPLVEKDSYLTPWDFKRPASRVSQEEAFLKGNETKHFSFFLHFGKSQISNSRISQLSDCPSDWLKELQGGLGPPKILKKTFFSFDSEKTRKNKLIGTGTIYFSFVASTAKEEIWDGTHVGLRQFWKQKCSLFAVFCTKLCLFWGKSGFQLRLLLLAHPQAQSQ